MYAVAFILYTRRIVTSNLDVHFLRHAEKLKWDKLNYIFSVAAIVTADSTIFAPTTTTTLYGFFALLIYEKSNI